MDSGTSFIGIPARAHARLISIITEHYACKNTPTVLLAHSYEVCDCTEQGLSAFPDLALSVRVGQTSGGGGDDDSTTIDLVLEPSDYVQVQRSNFYSVCIPSILPLTQDTNNDHNDAIILGTPFLRAFYVSFEADAEGGPRIGIALSAAARSPQLHPRTHPRSMFFAMFAVLLGFALASYGGRSVELRDAGALALIGRLCGGDEKDVAAVLLQQRVTCGGANTTTSNNSGTSSGSGVESAVNSTEGAARFHPRWFSCGLQLGTNSLNWAAKLVPHAIASAVNDLLLTWKFVAFVTVLVHHVWCINNSPAATASVAANGELGGAGIAITMLSSTTASTCSTDSVLHLSHCTDTNIAAASLCK